MKIFTYYNKNGIFMAGIFGYGVRAKNIKKAEYTGSMAGLYKFGAWIFLFGTVA